jgi:hypothetical protein
MPSLEFVWNGPDIARWRGQGVDNALTSALRKAGGDAIRAMRAEGKRRVRDRKFVRASYLAARALPLAFPRSSGSIDSLVWTMRVSGQPIGIERFKARQTREGVKVQVNRDGEQKLFKSAFIATMKSGHRGVFMRTAGKKRLPIEHVLSSRISDTMGDPPILQAVFARGDSVFASAFTRLMPLELAKLK